MSYKLDSIQNNQKMLLTQSGLQSFFLYIPFQVLQTNKQLQHTRGNVYFACYFSYSSALLQDQTAPQRPAPGVHDLVISDANSNLKLFRAQLVESRCERQPGRTSELHVFQIQTPMAPARCFDFAAWAPPLAKANSFPDGRLFVDQSVRVDNLPDSRGGSAVVGMNDDRNLYRLYNPLGSGHDTKSIGLMLPCLANPLIALVLHLAAEQAAGNSNQSFVPQIDILEKGRSIWSYFGRPPLPAAQVIDGYAMMTTGAFNPAEEDDFHFERWQNLPTRNSDLASMLLNTAKHNEERSHLPKAGACLIDAAKPLEMFYIENLGGAVGPPVGPAYT